MKAKNKCLESGRWRGLLPDAMRLHGARGTPQESDEKPANCRALCNQLEQWKYHFSKLC